MDLENAIFAVTYKDWKTNVRLCVLRSQIQVKITLHLLKDYLGSKSLYLCNTIFYKVNLLFTAVNETNLLCDVSTKLDSKV